MDSDPIERRLTAIMNADVVGYSRLMAQDEDATVRMVTFYRQEVEMLVPQHRGQLADFTGDNFLAQFPTALEAVRCAIEIQRVLAARNADVPPERRMQFRIGIHLGDVREAEERLFGTGVNIAARVQSLAQPGGICISSSVRAQLLGTLELGCKDLGEQQVKNIPEPVRVYAVELPEATAATPSKQPRWPIAAGIVLLLALVVAGWWLMREETTPPVVARKPLTSLVVLPFDDMSPQGDQEYFAHGMSEELTNVLAHTPSLRVLGRRTAEVVKQRGLTVAEIGQALGVDALIEGSVRRSGDRLRITAQLIAVEDGFHLWSQTYDRPMVDIFALQDEVAREVTRALEVALAGEPKRPPTNDLEAYQSHLRGRLAYSMATEEAIRAAIPPLERAIELDPQYADAFATLGSLYVSSWRYGWERGENLQRAEQLARRALEIDEGKPLAHVVLGMVHEFNYELRAAEAEYRRAVELAPQKGRFRTHLGMLAVARGDVENGMRLLDEGVSLDPLRYMSLAVAGWTQAHVGDPEHAVRLLKNAIDIHPGSPYGHGILALAYDKLGQEADALDALIGMGFPLETEAAIRKAHEERGMAGAWAVLLELRQSRSGLECTAHPVNGIEFLLRVGRREEALGCIEQSVEAHTLGVESYLKVDPNFDAIRDDPRFQAALEKMGLAD